MGDIAFNDPNWVAKSMRSNGESTFPIKEGTKAPWTPVAGDFIAIPIMVTTLYRTKSK